MFDLEAFKVEVRTRIVNGTGLPQEQAWENVAFEPPAPTKTAVYLRETTSVLTERPDMMESNIVLGVSIYDVMVAAGTGTQLMSSTAQAIRDAIPRSTDIRPPAPACPVNIQRLSREGGRQDGGNPSWYFLRVRINWISTDPNPFVP